MIITVTMKDPDCLSEPIEDAVKESLSTMGLEDDEIEAVVEARTSKVREKLVSKWFEYGEYLTVEIDTKTMTAKVMENK